MLHVIMQPDAVYDYPIWAVGAAMAAGTIGALVLIEALATWVFGHEVRRQHNGSTGWIFSIVGVTYGVLLAFVAMLALETFDAAKAATDQEAARLADVASLAPGVPEPARTLLQADLHAYADLVRSVEWPSQAAGHVSVAADRPLGQADAVVLALRPGDAAETNVQAALLRGLVRLRDARELRIATGASGIPAIVWFVVVAGGAISLAFVSLLGTFDRVFHLVLGSLLALSGVLVLLMIVALSHPFRGDFRITPEAFAAAVSQPRATQPEE